MTKLEKDIELFDKYIEHWKENVECVRKRMAPDISQYDCALCWEYKLFYGDCHMCPIYIKTGASCCDNTPYSEVLVMYERATMKYYGPTWWRKFRRACEDEVKFLHDLKQELIQRKEGQDE